MSVARELWKRIESIHAVTYFAPESAAAAKEAGLKGFWMGYFGFRAAPMGPVGPGPVHAAFANFARSMVERSLPDAWARATPAQLIEARASSAAAALRRTSPTLAHIGDTRSAGNAPTDQGVHASLCTSLSTLADHADPLGRPLFAANADLDDRADPVEHLWQLCTTLREHRGDGHVIALASHRVDGCEAHHLHAAAHGTPHEVLRDNRGFSAADWDAAALRLEERGLVARHELTAAGHDLVQEIETLTDELAIGPIDASGIDMVTLLDDLTPIANEITESGILPFPNPMGLPRL